MREGIQTFVFMILILLMPLLFFDLMLNNAEWWRFVAHHTSINDMIRHVETALAF